MAAPARPPYVDRPAVCKRHEELPIAATRSVEPPAGAPPVGAPELARGSGEAAASDGRTAGPTRAPLRRRTHGRVLAGVAGGVADHLGLPALHVRVAFVALSALTGFGVAVYLGLWAFVPQRRPEDEDQAAGLAAARRGGMRSIVRRRDDVGQVVALLALGAGLLLLAQGSSFGLPASVFWPAVIALAGVALLWLQADSTERRRLSGEAADQPGRRRRGWWRQLLRVVAGATLLGIGLGAFLAGERGWRLALEGLLAAAVMAAGVAVIAGPWLLRLWRELAAERRERILSQERADVAAHLHDSVLQTLALIQKQSDDPRAVVHLARRQERDLRAWLYAGPPDADGTLKPALLRTAAEVEDAHGVPVEVVAVGDAPVDEPLLALLAAAREAITNAAKHSGADVVDVYAEVSPEAVELFVRDRGRGFDPDAVPADRLGVRRSVVGRMERYGGSARVRSAPGEGAEVHLLLRRAP